MIWLAKLFSSRITFVVIGAAIAAVAIWNAIDGAYERGVLEERARQMRAMHQAIGEMRKRHEEELKQRGWQDMYEASAERKERLDMQLRIEALMKQPPKVLIKTEVVKDEAGCSCPTISLGDHFWVPYRAAGVRGEEADPATTNSVQD